MCGIAGFCNRPKNWKTDIETMKNRMAHRGPDGEGVWASEEKDVVLGHRRLSILDLSELGHQPMHAADGRVSLVFNGEIYNFEELRAQLSGYPFRSRCDTEVLLAAYEAWGISFVEKCSGMFAIALYDRQDGSLYLIRDRIGKKPLYYWEDGQNLVFGSELKAIMACPGFPRTLRRDVLPRYLFQQYIPEPDTVFEQVFQLLPGEMLRFCRGRAKKERYWSIPEKYREGMADPVTDYGEGKARLKELLTAAVKRRMIADVELGTFLSGGYDSSLVTAIAAGLSEKPVKTFSIGFEEAAYIDGCGYFKTMVSIMIPMAKPSILTVILFQFLSFWNEYIIAFTVMNEHITLAVGLKILMAVERTATNYGIMYAGLVIVMIPVLVLYICVQKQLTKGMTLGGLKG